MKRHLAAATILLAGAVSLAVAQTTPRGPTPAQPAGSAPAGEVKREITDVPVRRVVLFSSGVGFFQHSGKVTGNAAAELRFKTDQINDILKSLVVSDTSTGTVKSITYGSQNPVARTLRSFQIDISGNPSLAGILNQIRGTKIALTLADEKVEGTVLGVEEKDRPVGKPDEQKVIRVSFVNLITAAGIRSISLEDVRRLEIQDEALQKELDQALTALAQARDQNKKPVIVNFDGTGERIVTVAYLVETPVWKTSYRLILPDAASRDSAALQGWAIVENQTDNDWNNVTLDLVGGRPISFIQDLYQPMYVPRPRVQPKTYASLTPQTYDEGMELAKAAETVVPVAPPAGRGGRGGGGGGGGGFGGGGGAGLAAGGARGAAPQAAAARQAQGLLSMDAAEPMDFAQGVASIADAAKVGEMFQYSVKGVTLPRQRSSMIPIITAAVPFDRLSIYNRAVLQRNALRGVRLKNQGKDYLLAGPIAVLDKVRKADGTIVESYAGDATIDDVPPGQERLVSYAVDQELLVDSTKREPHEALITGSIVKGVLNLSYTDSMHQEYVLENKGDVDKQVLVEDPIEGGYELKSPPSALEKTDRVYRFQVAAPAKKSVKFEVVEERKRGQTWAILPMDLNTIEFYVRAREIPDKVKEVLRTAAERRRVMADAERKLQQRQADRNQIMQDEANIRANINVLVQGTKSYNDTVTDLANKDAELKQANKDIKDLQDALNKTRTDLESFLNEITVN